MVDSQCTPVHVICDAAEGRDDETGDTRTMREVPCSDTRDGMAILCSLIIDFAGVGLCWYQIFELPDTNVWICEVVVVCIRSIVPSFDDLRCWVVFAVMGAWA